MAVTSRAKRLGQLAGETYSKRKMADILSRRFIIEADTRTKELQEDIQENLLLAELATEATGLTADVAQKKALADKGGFEGGMFKFLTNPTERDLAIRRGQKAISLGEDYIYDVDTAGYVNTKSREFIDATKAKSGEDVMEQNIFGREFLNDDMDFDQRQLPVSNILNTLRGNRWVVFMTPYQKKVGMATKN